MKSSHYVLLPGRLPGADETEIKTFMEVTQQDTPPLGIGIDDRMPALMGLTTWKSYHEGRPVRLKEVNGKQELGGV